jgi:peptide/nickel transport system permease protein
VGRFILRRVLQAIPTFFGITLLSFTLIRLAPGDPLSLMVINFPTLSPENYEALRRAYGLDQPLPIQYLNWLGRMLTGDFGTSFLFKRPVIEMIQASLPNTLQLSILSLFTALVIGIPLGVLGARFRGGAIDQVIRVLGVAGHAIPGFWFALLFILVGAVELRWFPVAGMLTVGADPADIGDRLRHIVGPLLALSLGPVANFSRLMRTEMLDVIGQDFIRTARAKGVRETGVLFGHALRNALLPIITAAGSTVAALVSGAIVVEQVFAWPGMGRMTYEAARSKDYPIVMAVVVLASIMLLAAYLLRDVAYGIADPRVRRI